MRPYMTFNSAKYVKQIESALCKGVMFAMYQMEFAEVMKRMEPSYFTVTSVPAHWVFAHVEKLLQVWRLFRKHPKGGHPVVWSISRIHINLSVYSTVQHHVLWITRQFHLLTSIIKRNWKYNYKAEIKYLLITLLCQWDNILTEITKFRKFWSKNRTILERKAGNMPNLF